MMVNSVLKKALLSLILFPQLLQAATVKAVSESIVSLAPYSWNSMISNRVIEIPAGTAVTPICWSGDRLMIKAELPDGSRGYLPAYTLLKEKPVIKATEKELLGVSFDRSYDYRKNDLHSARRLPEGVYKVEDVDTWQFTNEGFAPAKLLLRSTQNGKYFIVSGQKYDGSFLLLDCYSSSPEVLKQLPTEESLIQETLYLTGSGRTSPDKLIGKSRAEIESAIGSASTWLTPVRTKKEELLAYYPNLAYKESYDRKHYSLGMGVYYSKESIATGWVGMPCTSVGVKEIKPVPLPAIGTDAGKAPSSEDIADEQYARFQENVEALSSLFARNRFLRIFELIILVALLYLAEWARIRLNLKIGSNKFARIGAYVVPAFLMLAMSELYAPYSTFWGLIYFLVIAALIYCGGYYMGKIIKEHRCDKCHRYSKEWISHVHKGRIYVLDYIEKNVRVVLDKNISVHILEGDILYYDITETIGQYEDHWISEERRNVTLTRRCPRCKQELINHDTEIIKSVALVLKEYNPFTDKEKSKPYALVIDVSDGNKELKLYQSDQYSNVFYDSDGHEWRRVSKERFERKE